MKISHLLVLLVLQLIIAMPSIAQASLELADDAFWKQIQAVSEGFNDYAHTNGAFPAFNMFGGQMVPVVRKSLADNLTNPYYKDRQQLVHQIRLEERMMADIDFRFFTDKTLDEERIDYYRTNPPAEWQGIPGTIAGVGNSKGDLIVFFGIGADGKPLADKVGDGMSLKFAVIQLEK